MLSKMLQSMEILCDALIKKEKIQELFNYCRKFNFEVQLYSLDNTIQIV